MPASALPSSALLTDHYELTMVQAALRSGVAGRRAVFAVFARQLPPGRRFGVVAGTGRLLEAVSRAAFGPDELDFLAAAGVVDDATCGWLAAHRFSGDIDGYAEGEPFFPDSPILIVSGGFAECVLLETLVLSVLNADCAVAAAAARMVAAAGGRPCLEFGSRRTHEQAAVAAARAAYIAGFDQTSNLEAGRQYGVPTAGTSAHSFTLAHDDELAAFRAQVEALGADTTLLVDTYDTLTGIRNAVAAAGPGLGAVRLDSGDLAGLAGQARQLLDSLGATGTRIVVTSDLDEHAIAALRAAPVDGYGVGTALVTGSGAPTAGLVYKMVARESTGGALQPVAKTSPGKVGRAGRPVAARRRDQAGSAVAEVITVGGMPAAAPQDRPLQVPLARAGSVVSPASLAQVRAHHRRSMAELPPRALRLSKGEPAIPTVHEEV